MRTCTTVRAQGERRRTVPKLRPETCYYKQSRCLHRHQYAYIPQSGRALRARTDAAASARRGRVRWLGVPSRSLARGCTKAPRARSGACPNAPAPALASSASRSAGGSASRRRTSARSSSYPRCSRRRGVWPAAVGTTAALRERRLLLPGRAPGPHRARRAARSHCAVARARSSLLPSSRERRSGAGAARAGAGDAVQHWRACPSALQNTSHPLLRACVCKQRAARYAGAPSPPRWMPVTPPRKADTAWAVWACGRWSVIVGYLVTQARALSTLSAAARGFVRHRADRARPSACVAAGAT